MRAVCGGDLRTSRRGSRNVTCLRKRRKVRFHAASLGSGHLFHVEVFLTLRRAIGKGDGHVRRRLAQHAQGELILLRTIPAGTHVVHGPALRHEKIEPVREKFLRQQKMIGFEAFVSRREVVTGVANQQFMQQRRSRSPMAQNEDGGLPDDRPANASSVNDFLNEAKQRVQQTHAGDDEGDVPARPVHGQSIAQEQSQPRQEVAAFPHARGPLRLSRGFLDGRRLFSQRRSS